MNYAKGNNVSCRSSTAHRDLRSRESGDVMSKGDGRGGVRAGAGRKRTAPEGVVRSSHTLRASASEWETVKAFAKILKHDPARARRMMETE